MNLVQRRTVYLYAPHIEQSIRKLNINTCMQIIATQQFIDTDNIVIII